MPRALGFPEPSCLGGGGAMVVSGGAGPAPGLLDSLPVPSGPKASLCEAGGTGLALTTAASGHASFLACREADT